MLYFSLTLSAIGLAVLVYLAIDYATSSLEIAGYGIVMSLVFSVPCVSILYGTMPTMLLGTVFVVIWKTNRWPVWFLLPLVILALIGGHLVPYLRHVAPSMREYDSIRHTLAEHTPNDRIDRRALPAIATQPRLNELWEQDNAIEVWRKSGLRQWRFEQLHGDQVRLFVNNPGFGVIRMQPTPHTLDYYMPKREPIPQPQRFVSSQAKPTVEHPVPPPLNYSSTHQRSVVEFAFPVGWGWERSPNQFIGFLPHQFGKHQDSEAEYYQYTPLDAERGWQVRSIELIGLLLDSRPRVYMTEFLPRMDEAKTAATRGLDEFESAGLRAVANGDELYYGHSREERIVRMIGGLRASKSCVSCHSVREGELLGAFSYVLAK